VGVEAADRYSPKHHILTANLGYLMYMKGTEKMVGRAAAPVLSMEVTTPLLIPPTSIGFRARASLAHKVPKEIAVVINMITELMDRVADTPQPAVTGGKEREV
jgi:hypothetical protein